MNKKADAKPTPQKRTRSRNVPGQLYGYSVQQTRMLYRLLEHYPLSSANAVSLEVLDDVAVHKENGALAEQVKSGLAHNPIADRSIDLWKTLFNWLEAIRFGEISLGTTSLVLHVVQAHKGAIAQQMSDVQGELEAHSLIAKLRNKFWGASPEYLEKFKLPAELGQYLNPVLEASDDVLAQLLIQFALETGTGDPVDEARRKLQQMPISSGAVERVLNQMLGWVKSQTDGLIEKRRLAIIPCELFRTQLLECIKATDRSSTALTSGAPDATPEEVSEQLQRRIYIKQLKAIDLDRTELEEAASDYLRAAADRTIWAEAGEVFEGNFDEFENKLRAAWRNKRRIDMLQIKLHTEIERGQLLYLGCREIRDVRLHGMDVPGHFVTGSFHALADSMQIGWHPQYEALLGK